MLLGVVVENTRTLVGIVDGEQVVRHWWLGTDGRRTADEWAVLLTGLLAGPPNRLDAIDGVAVCSAVPSVLRELREVVARHYGDLPGVVVEPGVKTGMPVLMDNPREVGTDRIVNALGAVQMFGGPCVVVSLGTATTYDVVNGSGAYIGGVIAPGIETSLDALGVRAAQLRRVELARPRTVVAKNTVEALQSGAVFGFAGQVDGIVDRIVAEVGWQPGEATVVATGALAWLVIDECRTVIRHEPWLGLRGLSLVFARNT